MVGLPRRIWASHSGQSDGWLRAMIGQASAAVYPCSSSRRCWSVWFWAEPCSSRTWCSEMSPGCNSTGTTSAGSNSPGRTPPTKRPFWLWS